MSVEEIVSEIKRLDKDKSDMFEFLGERFLWNDYLKWKLAKYDKEREEASKPVAETLFKPVTLTNEEIHVIYNKPSGRGRIIPTDSV